MNHIKNVSGQVTGKTIRVADMDYAVDYTAHYPSPLGDITLVSDGAALTGLWFDGQKHFAAPLLEAHGSAGGNLSVFDTAKRWLDLYFCGREPGFTPPLALRGTIFRQRVWRELLSIPYGQTTTYGHLARRLCCRSAQAIGGAVGHNPIGLIVPCHRVIGVDGALTGYAAGIGRKARLLQMEGVTIDGQTI